MNDIFRIFECHNGTLEELVFICGLDNAFQYLESCEKHNTDKNTFYFMERIKIEH